MAGLLFPAGGLRVGRRRHARDEHEVVRKRRAILEPDLDAPGLGDRCLGRDERQMLTGGRGNRDADRPAPVRGPGAPTGRDRHCAGEQPERDASAEADDSGGQRMSTHAV